MPQLTVLSSPHPSAVPDLSALIAERIRGEFREMPGLTLTAAQARRLWSLDAHTCDRALELLVDSGFLCRRGDGAFSRRTDLSIHQAQMAKATLRPGDAGRRRRTAR